MIQRAIPVLHVRSSQAAEAFYCGKLGFRRDFAHRSAAADPCYMGISRDGIELHLSSLSGDGVVGCAVILVVDDVDSLHREFISRQVSIDTGPVDQTWGTREMYVKDGDGNSVRFQQLGKG